MIEEKELTLSELNKITWDYSEPDVIGYYDNQLIKGFLFEVKECSSGYSR